MKYINKCDIDLTNQVGYGAEGIVYDINNKEVAKILNNPTDRKMGKINKLSKLKINNFIFPNNIIVNNSNIKIGFTMDKIDIIKNQSLEDKFDELDTTTKKIYYLKKLEENMKLAHKKKLIIVDFNFENFLTDGKNLTMIDTDNYTYKMYLTDLFPRYYYFYYFDKIDKNITPNVDKFMFTMKVLETLVGNSINKLELTGYYDDRLEEYIKKLDINKVMKEFFLMQISDTKNKEYFNDLLDQLKSDKQFILQK